MGWNWRVVSYENNVRNLYSNATFSQRRFSTYVDGKLVHRVADDVTVIGGRRTAIESKYVESWSNSLRNPESANGSRPWAIAEQNKMIE